MIGMKLIKNPKFGVIKASCSINDDNNECKKYFILNFKKTK